MEEIVQFLAHYGYVVLFAWVLAEQIGLPLPAAPVLLAAGALAGRGLFHLSATLTVAVTSTGQTIGTLTNSGGGTYKAQFSWPTNPLSVTIKSSLGGASTAIVTTK